MRVRRDGGRASEDEDEANGLTAARARTRQEFATTSSSRHHGQKVKDSRDAEVRRAIEGVEASLARAYCVIDRGDDVCDLTAPAVVKRIREMDRLGLTYETPKYLTYPEDAPRDATTAMIERDDGAEMDLIDDDVTKLALALRRAETMPLVLSKMERASGAMTVSTRRPPPRLAHDASIGAFPEARVEDDVKDALVDELDARGNLSEIAYRDLDGLD